MKTSQDNFELFPHESFDVRLEHIDEKRICWFKDDVDLQKYVNRYKLDKRTIKIDYRDGQPTIPSKKHKRSVEQNPEPESKRSSGSGKKRARSLDSTSNSSSNTKLKKK